MRRIAITTILLCLYPSLCVADVWSAIYSTNVDDEDYWDGSEEWGYNYVDGGDYFNPVPHVSEAARNTEYPNSYTSLQAWEDAQDGNADAGVQYAIIMGPWTAYDTTDFDIDDGWSSSNIIVRAIGTARTAGVWDSTDAYTLSVDLDTDGHCCDTNYIIRWDGFQWHDSGAGQNGVALLRFGTPTACFVTNCMFQTTDESTGIDCDAAVSLTVWNTIVYCLGTQGTGSEGIHSTAASTFTLYNCTVDNYDDGIEDSGGTTVANSCAVVNCDDCLDAWETETYMATTDGSAPEGANSIDISGSYAADDFTDYANENFNVQDAASALYDAGDDLSGTFTKSIAGTSRPQGAEFDIGAHELVVAAPGGGQVIRVIMTSLPIWLVAGLAIGFTMTVKGK